MTRKDMKTIIKARSAWKIDRRKGNYTLPDGSPVKWYISTLIRSQLELDELAIAEDGNIYPLVGSFTWNEDRKDFDGAAIMVSYEDNEIIGYFDYLNRIDALAMEMIR